jgi:diguanylate cyclase (GGDEF)-like protein
MKYLGSIRVKVIGPNSFLFLLAMLLTGLEVQGQSLHLPLSKPDVVTSARDAHSLSNVEASRSYPVHLKAVVTYYDSSIDVRHIAMFVHDSTGSIFVSVPQETTWPGGRPSAGTTVDISGVSAPGDFASIIDQPHIRIVSRSHILPQAKRVGLAELLAGTEDGQWVEIEGIVQSVFQTSTNATLEISMDNGTIGATTTLPSGFDYSKLIDSKVRLHGNAAPLFNGDRQMTGARLFFPNMSAVVVEGSSASEAFSTPARPIDTLSRFSPVPNLSHQVHVRGTVTLQWPGSMVCIQDASQGLCMQTLQTTQLQVGEMADVVGSIALGGYRPTLIDALFKPLGGKETISASPVTGEQALLGGYDAELVQIEGELIASNLVADNTTLMLSAGKVIFSAILPPGLNASSIASLRNGSKLRLSGICSVQVDNQRTQHGEGSAITKSFRILLRSPADVTILQTPSFWTATRILFLLVAVLAVTAAVLGWVIVLRRRVEQQTKVIRQSEERFRHQAQHDALTGLPTRRLLDDRLRTALERAGRLKTGVALFMLDLDNFKQVNDSLGHDIGDRTLLLAAERICATIRKSDTVARMGGDEFVIVVSDLAGVGDAEHIATQIVASFAAPMEIGSHRISVSVSIGIYTIFDGATDATVLLKCVDRAMYEAKAQGRNRFQVYNADIAGAIANKLEPLNIRPSLVVDEIYR